MKNLFMAAWVWLWLTTLPSFATTPPDRVTDAFKKRNPASTEVIWSQDDGYYCAHFKKNGWAQEDWFNADGQWVMSQTDWVGLDPLSATVYNAFVSGPYASWVVKNVTRVTFPRWEPILVIRVTQDNVDLQYQLFYAPNGRLLKTRDVTYLDDALGPSTFLPS